MITFKEIYEISRKERFSEELQSIPKNFISEFSKYLKEKREISSKEDDLFSDVIIKTKKQIENAVILFKEIMLRRRKKILNLILIASETGIPKKEYENMFDFEKELFDKLMKNIEESNKKVNEILNGKKQEVKKNKMIFLKENVEEFLDFNGEKMGPFEKGQIINIPNQIADILIKDKKAELIEK